MKRSSRTPRTGATGRRERSALAGTNIERAGDHNQRVTLQAIRIGGAVTRAELASLTGLTGAAIANITGRLLRQKLIIEAGRRRGGRGQPAARLAINPNGCYSVGLNIDRDHVTFVLLDFLGQVRGRVSEEIAFASPKDVHGFLRRAKSQTLKSAGIGEARLVGAGVAFPTDLTRTQLPDQPADYSIWASTRVDKLVADVIDVRVFVENDATAAAIGELHFGSGHHYRSFFYLLVTAALGGGVVTNGSYFRGADGRSGEIGWLHAVDAQHHDAQLQKIVSLSGLYSRLGAAGFKVSAPQDLPLVASSAEPVIEGWVAECTNALTEALIAVNCLVNPEAILIGGRLPAVLVDRLAAALNERMTRMASQLPAVAPVARAALADDAPAVGAAILPFSDRFLPFR